jgi:hypothetical protein
MHVYVILAPGLLLFDAIAAIENGPRRIIN